MKPPISETIVAGFVAIVLIISLEAKHDTELEAAFDLGTENGKKIAQLEIKESLKKQVTNQTCLNWWFSNDPKRVGTAIQKIKLEASK